MSEQNKKNELKVADNIAGAEYANLVQIAHNKEEFRLMFAHVFEPTGKVVGKITTSPGHFKRMLGAMKENLEKYEEQFGAIEEAKGLQKGIGFSAEKETDQ